MVNKTAILIPIYTNALTLLERYSLDYSLRSLKDRDIFFIAPSSLQTSYYQEYYPLIPFEYFDDHYFASIASYNKLLLGTDFYERYARYEFVLLVHTDAIILKDHLDYWESTPFDYIGAPWPQGMSHLVNFGKFAGEGCNKQVRAHVGNGGLSLRRIRKCSQLLREFPDAVQIYNQMGFNEDCFFSIMGLLSANFIIPNEITASLFSLELLPEHYYAIRHQDPMAIHAWWKYNPKFWLLKLRPLPSVLLEVIDYLRSSDRNDEADDIASLFVMSDAVHQPTSHIHQGSSMQNAEQVIENYLATHIEYLGHRIQVDITEEEHTRLFSRIQQQWTDYGDSEPYVSVLSEEKYLLATIQDNIEEFHDSGNNIVTLLKTLATRNDITIPLGTCFELGCGVGRITLPLAKLFTQVIAADISPGNLAICKESLARADLRNAEPVLLKSPRDIESVDRFDVFISIIVLQHNPPPIQFYLLDKILGKVNHGGICLFQTATYNPNYAYAVDFHLGMDKAAFERWSLHCLPMRFIMELFRKHGFSVCEVVQDSFSHGLLNKFHSHSFFAVKNISPSSAR